MHLSELASTSATPISIGKIQQWLAHHLDEYEKAKRDKAAIPSCFGDLPCECIFESEAAKFVEVYNEVNSFAELHTHEMLAEKALGHLNSINNTQDDLSGWLQEYMDFGADYLACFLDNHFDYSKGDIDKQHLLLRLSQKELYVDRGDFIHLIMFKELFDKLYYV